MARVQPALWRPSGISELEPAAWNALRCDGSASVVAGPGAGKTEFLAQRAVYLLETGLCRPPQRILAISFKTDAARNLADRVRQRCPLELADRFVSMTFDAFTKSLVDRFVNAIPVDWRPTPDYNVYLPKRKQVDGFLTEARFSAPREWQADIAAYEPSEFEPKVVGNHSLPLGRSAPRDAREYAIESWWSDLLPPDQRSSLTFVAINRLAELLLRTNPAIRRALIATYPYVFVDEFQDTSYAQYGFLLTAFAGGSTVVTGVGDDKQRIMTFAGARPDAFQRLTADFGATRFPLLFNFRSSPDLVAIQQVVARALDPTAVQTIAKSERKVDGDVAQVWISNSIRGEADHLADWLVSDMANRGRTPRDYCILVKQTAGVFAKDLADAFALKGLRIRNESQDLGKMSLQDLLSDDISRLVIAILRLGVTRSAPTSWRIATSSLMALRGIVKDDANGALRVEEDFSRFVRTLRRGMSSTPPSRESAAELVGRVFDYLDPDAIPRAFPEYGLGDLLTITMEALCRHLCASAENAEDWARCLDAFEGVDQIPLMTVHKSKGLEYDTIVFVGLDDRAWWAHTPGDPEGVAAFFVALSRAKQRAIFSFCEARGQRVKVGDLYDLLRRAGVPEVAIQSRS